MRSAFPPDRKVMDLAATDDCDQQGLVAMLLVMGVPSAKNPVT
jgi:hypothetical protein